MSAHKFLLPICILFLLQSSIYAQRQLNMGLQYSHEHISDYAGFYLSKELNKHEFKLGLRYQLQSRIPKQGVHFRGNGYGKELSERLGLELGYYYKLKTAFKNRLEYKVGYHFSHIRTGIRSFFVPTLISIEDSVQVLAHHLMGKVSYNLPKNTRIWIRTGLGITSYFNINRQFAQQPKINLWGQKFSYSFILGVGVESPIWQARARPHPNPPELMKTLN